ncbi:hypothetical protein T492DRAFT_870383 [Pavlovales sp. CCMP2436]|nr:hypothetical protein T492DRAFT_870383 [Pavlovales sp. CCMP2436]
MSYTVLRPYARKFATVYSQVVDVAAVKTSVLEAWTLKLNNALTQYGTSNFFGNTTLYGTLRAYGDVNLATLEVLYGLMVRGVSTFTAAVTFQARVDLPAATYVNGSLLEPPVNITITGCTASDSWLVQTDNTGSEFQVQATAAFNPFTVGNADALCKVSPRLTAAFQIFWRMSVVTIATGGSTFCSVGEWELLSQRGPLSLVSVEPTSLSTFKLVLTDPQGTPVSTAGIAQDWDVHLCLTKGGKVANSGLYRFAPDESGTLGVVTKLS